MNTENFINGYPGYEHGLRKAVCEVLGPGLSEFFFDRMLDYFFTEDDVIFMKELGTNVVRLPLNYRHFEDDRKPFSYIENCRMDDPQLPDGLDMFLRAANVADVLRGGVKIGLIGQRIDFFWTTIVNESELLERFNVELLPIDICLSSSGAPRSEQETIGLNIRTNSARRNKNMTWSDSMMTDQ